MTGSHVWIDASAGVAGDMLLGALVDAGAGLDAVRAAVDAVVPGAVEITADRVRRGGLHAFKVNVVPAVADVPHRTWADIRGLLERADLEPHVRDRAAAVFATLARAEAAVHGTAADDVHFHEVGALDSIADVVGVCAALATLGAATVSAGEVAVGSGRTSGAHGDMPIPVPAVAELARGWRIRAGGRGELATPTGMALIRTLAPVCEDVPSMTVTATGYGAGTKDFPDRANVVRVLVGDTASHAPAAATILEANVDDLDPRLWPGVLAGLLADGAADAWLVPIVMKKGRPAHTLTVLCSPELVPVLRARIFRDTSTLGVRASARQKYALDRSFVKVDVGGTPITVKIGHAGGLIVQVMPEFDEVAALAAAGDRAERVVLQQAAAAAAAAGFVVGAAADPAIGPS